VSNYKPLKVTEGKRL